MKRYILPFYALILLLAFQISETNVLAVTTYDLSSPNGKIQIHIQTGRRLTYDVSVDGKPILEASTLSIDIDHSTLGLNPTVKNTKTNAVHREIQSPVP